MSTMPSEYQAKEQICEIGRRRLQKGFAAANDGNISYRLNDREILCYADHGLQGIHEARGFVQGRLRRQAVRRHPQADAARFSCICRFTRHRPDVKAVVHCHPPHATAFAVARATDSQVHLAGSRGLPGRGADRPSTKRPARKSSPRPSCRYLKSMQHHHSGQSRHGDVRPGPGKGLLE